MPRRDYDAPEETPAAAVPCKECGGKPGYDPQTGIELKQGHYSSCSQWVQ